MRASVFRETPTFVEDFIIPDGRAGVIETLKLMRRIVRLYRRDDRIHGQARMLVSQCPQKAYGCQIEKIFRFVQHNIRYVEDINEVETLQTPDKTLEMGQGDCDDKSTLLAALLEAVGHPTRFRAVGFDEAGAELSHVYVETRKGEDWIALDPIMPYAVGWYPPDITSHYLVHNS